ncbi:50S ribosomal protein L10 [Candidatus Mycoplasma haematominutum]|uniref:Large ribosomal subunit protein uL10 n=1 Tax=Candidatus Mycoplasma haematominutum 'Birmingham 1' TaxID=1116213 RepID=G8C311_9MOLU|nr:50S ribosomal protein L10 [Candidatus Mycoplasma haematominutum]CCE66709.1 ribosomal protein L10 [Candidatus Mycoplasma haematominutum 'Birmingham 1']
MRSSHTVKEQQVRVLVQKMRESASFATVKYSSLGAKSSEWLRREVKKYEGEVKMVSNNVLKRALAQFTEGAEVGEIAGQHFLLLIKSEQIAPLKLLAQLVKKYELLNFGAVYCNNKFLTEKQREYIPNWLDREAVLSKFAYLLNYPILSLIFNIKAIAAKSEVR